MNFNFTDGDFSNYNHAGHVDCLLQSNGKVDLIPEREKRGKIGLSEIGMFHLVKGWIESYSNMRSCYKDELIKLLNEK